MTKCPKCNYDYPYEDNNLWNCPDCNFSWSEQDLSEQLNKKEDEASVEFVVRDAHGNVLKDGDTVSVIKDLKVKGASSALKVGTTVKNIRLVESSDGHNISCRIDGFGAMGLKSEFVKKV